MEPAQLTAHFASQFSLVSVSDLKRIDRFLGVLIGNPETGLTANARQRWYRVSTRACRPEVPTRARVSNKGLQAPVLTRLGAAGKFTVKWLL